MQIEHVYRTAVSDIILFLIGKNSSVFFQENFRAFKNNRNIRRRRLADENVYKTSSRYLGKGLSLAVLNGQKRPLSTLIEDFGIFPFQFLSDLGRSKSVLGPFFVFLTKT